MNFSNNNDHSSNPLAINFGKVLPVFILYRLISSDRSVKFIIYELHRMNNCLKSNKHNCNDKISPCSMLTLILVTFLWILEFYIQVIEWHCWIGTRLADEVCNIFNIKFLSFQSFRKHNGFVKDSQCMHGPFRETGHCSNVFWSRI